MTTRMILLLATLFPALAGASDWVELGKTPEAQVMLDQGSVEAMGDDVMARVKFVYRQVQPAQTISQGSPFDSSINQFYVACPARKYQVLELTVYYRNKAVGSFHANLDKSSLDQPKLGSGVMLLIGRVCPKQPGSPLPPLN